MGGGYAARLFLLFSFHERDWPPCKVFSFFGLATNTLNVRNSNNNNMVAVFLLKSLHSNSSKQK